MPTQFDALHLPQLLDAPTDDRATRVFAAVIVVLWAVASLSLWGAS
jgi:hypothetical protein